MGELIVTPNIERPDDLYAALIAAHDGLDADQSAALNARLVLVLANHVGDEAVIRAALAVAQGAAEK